MSKRILSIALAMLLIIYAAGCGANNADTAGKVSDEATEHTTQPQGPAEVPATEETIEETIDVDNNLLTVDLTIPASFFGGATVDTASIVETYGITSAVVNEDGTLTLSMTKQRQRELLDESAAGIDEMISQYLDPEHPAYTPCFQDISHNEDFTAYTFTVNSGTEESEYSLNESLLAFSTAFYHLFSGIESHIEFTIVDGSTGEIISTSTY